MLISDNILSIRDRIQKACARSRNVSNRVSLVAVTKTVDVEKIKDAVQCGINILGENKVQEIIDKFPYITNDAKWHMIGHLQTNKVKYITDKVQMIHSVDTLKLVDEINKRFKIQGRIIDILVEINISREKSKYGVDPADLVLFLNKANKYEYVHIIGLMTVAPACDDPEVTRPYFREMKDIFENIKSKDIENINMMILSMGMTNDFEVAIEEGSNMVRIGSGIFGPRKY